MDQGEHSERHSILDALHDRRPGAALHGGRRRDHGPAVRHRAGAPVVEPEPQRDAARFGRARRERRACAPAVAQQPRGRRGRAVARAARRRGAADSQLSRDAEHQARLRRRGPAHDARDAERSAVRLDVQALRVLGSLSDRREPAARRRLGGDHEQHSAERQQQQQLLHHRGPADAARPGAAARDPLGVAALSGDDAHPAAARAHVHAAGVGRLERDRSRRGDQRVHGEQVLAEGRRDRQAIQVRQRDRHARIAGSRSSASPRTSSTGS